MLYYLLLTVKLYSLTSVYLECISTDILLLAYCGTLSKNLRKYAEKVSAEKIIAKCYVLRWNRLTYRVRSSYSTFWIQSPPPPCQSQRPSLFMKDHFHEVQLTNYLFSINSLVCLSEPFQSTRFLWSLYWWSFSGRRE